ncbi:MAG: hypothetical protein V4717_19560 [Bacteroidota bacterium]
MNSKLPYILAIFFGLIVPFMPQMEPYPFVLGLVYFVGGSLFGFFWPKASWRWGVWIMGPMIFFLLLSVAFAGQVEVFLKKDLPVLIMAIVATCLGAFLFARFKQSRRKFTEEQLPNAASNQN